MGNSETVQHNFQLVCNNTHHTADTVMNILVVLFSMQGRLIIFIKKFLIVKCWICLPSPRINNEQQVNFLYTRIHSIVQKVSVSLFLYSVAVTQTFTNIHDKRFHFFKWWLHVKPITVHFSKNCAHANTMEFCAQNKNYRSCKKVWKWEDLKLMQNLLTKIFLDRVI